MSARAYLRDLTRDAHDRVDAIFSKHDLGKADDYRAFLLAHAAAYLPVEQALDEAGAGRLINGWQDRRRGDLLRQDLAALNLPEPAAAQAPLFDDEASIVGGAYVLEGSRLGGAVLHRAVGPDLPTSFLGAPQQAGAWSHFIADIERILYSRVRQERAGVAALNTFACFELAAR